MARAPRSGGVAAARPHADVDARVVRVVDVKTPGSGEESRNLYPQLRQLRGHDQIKFVITSRADYEWSRAKIAELGLGRDCGVLFSPSYGQIEARELAEWILADHLPVLRAAGVKWDLRKAQPYANYKNFDFEIPTGQHGDTYDRYLVRMVEMRQSLRIIQQAVEGIPEGPIMAKVPKVMKPPVGEIYHSIEAPKGELGYFIVSDGSTQPYRVRVRPPSFVNLQALDVMCRGAMVADVVAVIGTLDIVLGEVDR